MCASSPKVLDNTSLTIAFITSYIYLLSFLTSIFIHGLLKIVTFLDLFTFLNLHFIHSLPHNLTFSSPYGSKSSFHPLPTPLFATHIFIFGFYPSKMENFTIFLFSNGPITALIGSKQAKRS